MNEPNKQLKRREFLKNATPVAALALGAPGWRSLLAAAGPNDAAAIPQGSIPSETRRAAASADPDRHSAGYVRPRDAGGPAGCSQGLRT